MTAAPARVAHRTPPRPARRHLRVVRDAPRPRRFRVAMAVTLVVSLIAVFGVGAFNLFLVQSQFQLERLEQELDRERQEFERLRLEAARLSSPERILDLARRELGMVDPEAVTHLTAPSDAEPGEENDSRARAWAEVKPHLASEP